jgi:hypothetical protein
MRTRGWRGPKIQARRERPSARRGPKPARSLSREEIQALYPGANTAKRSKLSTSYRPPCEKGADQVFIYGLADPRDHVIMYVGKTSMRLESRLRWHLDEPTNYSMFKWFDELGLAGLVPEVCVLEICHRKQWEKAERKWIRVMRSLGKMYNIEDGGDTARQRLSQNGSGRG